MIVGCVELAKRELWVLAHAEARVTCAVGCAGMLHSAQHAEASGPMPKTLSEAIFLCQLRCYLLYT